MKKLSRIVCLLLAFVMVFSVISLAPVRAAEISENDMTVAEVQPETQPTEENLTEVTEFVSEETLLTEDSSLLSARATYENGKYRQKALIWTTNGESISYTYDGEYNNYSILMMHNIWYNESFRTAYCIEPGKTVYNSSDYDEVTHSGTDPWGKLDYAKQRGVSLAILYGYPNSLDSNDLRTQLAYQTATGIIIHEIILGWRNSTFPFTRINDAYFNVFGGGTEKNPEKLEITSEYYSEVNTKHLRSEDIWYAYNYISNRLATHDLVPSFSSRYESQMPTYTMTAKADGTYSITLTDTNNILSAYDFKNTDDLMFVKSTDGKSLTITTSNNNLGTIAVAPTRNVPSTQNSAFLIWNAETGSQAMCTLQAPNYDPVPAFFQLKLPNGNLVIDKLASDGNAGGWLFGVYADEACTQPVEGPLSTTPGGKAIINNLPVGTYWVKELGHTTEGVADKYTCASNNPECVTITAGETTTVRFLNTLIPTGHLSVIKSTDSNIDTMGWKFALYADEACQTLVYGPVATDPNGIALFTNLKTGTYWLKEIGNTNPELCEIYTCTNQNPQPVTILADDTVNVYFHNKMNTGSITIQKTDPYQNALAGAHFLLEWSVSGSIWTPVESSSIPGWGKCTTPGIKDGILVTDSSGGICFRGLPLGVYYRVSEVKAPNGFQLLEDYAYEGMLTANGEAVTVNVINAPIFTLPHTGSRSMIGMSAGIALCLLTCVGAVLYLKKKEL